MTPRTSSGSSRSATARRSSWPRTRSSRRSSRSRPSRCRPPTPPRTFCPDPCGGFLGASADRGAGADAGAPGGVTVHHQAAIGPYETATIGSEDPEALVNWLNENHYTVPDEMLPVIRHYTDQGMDFAVLRLSPNYGVNQMQPVRVTMPGLNPTFPLRMVAAGVEGSVGSRALRLRRGPLRADELRGGRGGARRAHLRLGHEPLQLRRALRPRAGTPRTAASGSPSSRRRRPTGRSATTSATTTTGSPTRRRTTGRS